MPYSLTQQGSKYCVVGSTGSAVPGGCHTTKSAAQRHMRALYANVSEARTKAMPADLKQGLCEKFGADEGFFTRCMQSSLGGAITGDQKSFCAWLHHECIGKWPGEASAKEIADTEAIALKADYHARAGQTIAGNLKRGNDGKFENAGASSAATPAKKPAPKQSSSRPAAKPKRLPKSRSARARAAKPKVPKGAKPKDPEKERERQLHEEQRQLDRMDRQRRQQATDERLAKHEAEHAADRAQRATDRAAREAERQARLNKPEKVKPPEKPKKGGGGGKGGKGGKNEAAASSDRLDQQLSLLRRLIGRRGKSFTVFKQADGQYRWVAFSSTAYRDRDGEIVSTKALEDDCNRADRDKDYGPLRWWHTGFPHGSGLDLGDCDFNAMSGRVLIESGTFRTEKIAQKVVAVVDRLDMSLGFIHPPDEPDAEKVFHHIRRFERSLVPRGKASNLFTDFRIKEPDMATLRERWNEAKKMFGFSDDDLKEIEAGAVAKEKEADERHVAYKEAPSVPDTITINGVAYKEVSEKAPPAPPAVATAVAHPATGTVDDPEDLTDQGADEATEDPGAGGPYVGDMTPDEFMTLLAQALTQALAPVVSAMDFESKMRGHMDEFKTLFSGYQSTKDDEAARQQETIAALQQQATTQEATLKETQGKLSELLGDQPRAGGYRASQDPATAVSDETRLKAAQPQADPYINTFLKEFVLGQQPAQ